MESLMQQKQNCENKSNNISRFLVPFYLKQTDKKVEKILFHEKEWEIVHKPTVYLTKYIQEIYTLDERFNFKIF